MTSLLSRYWHAARRAVGLGFGRTIEDDRGRAVQPWLRRPWWGGETRRAPISNAVLERVIRRMHPRFSYRRRMLMRGAFWALFVVAWLYLVVVVWKLHLRASFPLVIGTLAGIMSGVVVRFAQRRVVPRDIPVWKLRDAMLAEGLCPSCGYTIRGLEIRPDGFVTCPECAAEWKRGSPDPMLADA